MDNVCVCCGAIAPEGTRDTGTAVFHPLAELMGIYVEIVTIT